ncbi:nascent polypeptide-associated complex subunit alpha, muscle-specific form [Zalophus californianus]|uniref:Nascent polypeptide-associated complex subunit alpha, muscle-specific form n=1 Tax=Zalophus californianus TaxID=9704 RepID=A0A6P9F5X5_ZALCA|nr:nascent polypeptide-associated complex subunit alpha, muscle-specific form [Zalophus californianus]
MTGGLLDSKAGATDAILPALPCITTTTTKLSVLLKMPGENPESERITAGGPEAASGAVTVPGGMGGKRGEGRRGVGEATGAARGAPLPGSAEVRRVQTVARSPEAPELLLLLPGLPWARRAGARSHPPPASSGQDPAGTHPPPPAPPAGGSAPGAPTRTSCRPPAPQQSLFAPRLLPPRRRRLRLPLRASRLSSSEPPAAEGAAAPGC